MNFWEFLLRNPDDCWICRLARGDIFGVLSEFFMLLGLLQESENKRNLPPKEMPGTELTSYLRSHRLKSGFSRRELAEITGLLTKTQVGRHERSNLLPSLIAALSYQAIFRIPITELFPGLYESIVQGVEERLSALEYVLENSSGQGSKANLIATKLVWLNERKGSTITESKE